MEPNFLEFDFDYSNELQLLQLGLRENNSEDDDKYLNKKTNQKRNSNNRYIAIPWIIFEEFGDFGGIRSFIVLVFFLSYRNTNFEILTSLKIISEWAKITRNKLETVQKIIYSLKDFIEIPNQMQDAKLSTPLVFRLKLYKTPYFFIDNSYLTLLKEKGGFEMFTIFSVLSSIASKKDYFTNYANKYKHAVISLEKLAKKTEMSPNTISKYLKMLVEKKYICSYRTFNKEKNVYNCTQYTLFNKQGKKSYFSTRNKKNDSNG